jgi:hypothetical protein
MNKEIEQTVLPGPPVSRSKQRKLAIAKFVPGLGYQKMLCASCGKHTWIGPQQVELLAKYPDARVLCFCCVRINGGDVFYNLNARGGAYYFTDGTYAGPTEGLC